MCFVQRNVRVQSERSTFQAFGGYREHDNQSLLCSLHFSFSRHQQLDFVVRHLQRLGHGCHPLSHVPCFRRNLVGTVQHVFVRQRGHLVDRALRIVLDPVRFARFY